MKTFDRKHASVDWKRFGSIELKRLSEEIRTNNLVVNELGDCIAFCDIDSEMNIQEIDQNFVKLFKISQILIEFLLTEFNRLKGNENERKSQNNLIRENKKLRKLLEIQQKAMTYSRTLTGENVQCPHCPKVFFDPIFLKTHMTRRHPNESLDSEGMLSLTDKIKDYQKILIGDNQSLDQMKEEIQVLTQKLTKTESLLVSEKEERLKLEERIEYVIKIRDKEIQQTLREELEELKFVQRERHIEEDIERKHKKVEIDSNKSEEKHSKVNEMNKIEEIIAIQAKEMIKLGNNVQKLVSHLTENPEESHSGKAKLRALTNSFDKIQSKVQNDFQDLKEHTNKEEIQTTEANEVKTGWTQRPQLEPEVKDFSSDANKQTVDKRNQSTGITDAFNEVQRNLKDKLVSLGIDVNCVGISDEEYCEAMRKLNKERDLLIQQNRFDYDFNAIEQQIRKFVDKKVTERMSDFKVQAIDTITKTIEVKESRVPVEKDVQTDPQKVSKHSVEAIVHSSPVTELTIYNKNQISSEEFDSKSDSKEDLVEKAVIEEKSPKPVLKSIISDRKGSAVNDIKAKQRRIRFSEHRIEHQISPLESSDDSSEDYPPIDPKAYESTPAVPIPAQRTRKTDLTLDLKDRQTEESNDDSSDDNNYEIDDQLMDEILHTNAFVNKEDTNEVQAFSSENSSHQTKVQELAEMIEQQLNKRSAAHKKPPIGSVDVMTDRKSNKTSVRRSDVDSYDSD